MSTKKDWLPIIIERWIKLKHVDVSSYAWNLRITHAGYSLLTFHPPFAIGHKIRLVLASAEGHHL